MREIFIPLAVDPVQPPTNMSTKSTSWPSGGQSSKSSVAKPVVVRIEVTWNRAVRRARSRS